MSTVIRAEGLVVTYGRALRALGGVSLAVAPGEFVAVLGPSGAGKTTLFRCLTGLARPEAGSVWLHGRDLCRLDGRALRDARRDIALIFQQFNLIRRLSALQNVLAGRLAAVPTWRVLARHFPATDRALALSCLDRVGMRERADARADRLSGGQQQRVAIARALAMEPRLMLLDEITSALDPQLVAEVLQLVRELAESGMTMIIATHEMSFARDIANRVCFLDAGVILEQGPPEQIFTAPHEERTQQFLARIVAAGRM